MIYAFDFDGVLVENHEELPNFTKIAWEKTTGRKCTADADEIMKFRPWVKNAAEIYGLIVLLEKKSDVTKEKIKEVTASENTNAKKFAENFYSERQRMQHSEREKWLKFYKKHIFVADVFNNMAKTGNVYIVTSKDKKTISNLVKHFGLRISDRKILAKELSFDKLDHVNFIRKSENVEYKDIVFIDDALDHLKPLKKKGVRTILASWGYVTNEDMKEAKNHGIDIATRENFAKMINTEYFDVIDKSNKVIGKAPRDECHKKGLLHRAVHIMILNRKGEFLLQKRSKKKDLYSGWWTSSASGHVASGDDYDETAHRELKEELGVKAKLKPMFVVVKNYKGEGKHDRERIKFYIGSHDGPFGINREEVDKVRFFTPKKINEMMKKEKFTPGTVSVLKELRKHPELLKRLSLS